MAAGYLISALLSAILSRRMLWQYHGVRRIFQQYRGKALEYARQKELFADLLPNLWRQGAISAADFLNSRALVLLVSGSLGLEVSSGFGLLQQVTGLVTTSANALFNAYLPLFGECRLRGDVPRSRRLFFRAVGVQWGILLCGGAGVLLFGNPVLSLLGASGRLPATGITFAYLSLIHILWGNPLYNWEAIRQDGYGWWVRRVRAASKLYDVTRIDHFRGFESYYAIPFGEETAEHGEWLKGPGYALFETIERELGEVSIIAEDLGLSLIHIFPIVPGIMPMMSKSQVQRMIFTCGVSLPSRIIRILHKYENDPQSLEQAGIEYACEQVTDLIKNDVDGIHIYTMNKPQVAAACKSRIDFLLK